MQSNTSSAYFRPQFQPPPRSCFFVSYFMYMVNGSTLPPSFFMPQELGTEVIRVLVRNPDLFRAIAGASAVDGEAGQGRGEGSLAQRLASETAGEAAVAGGARTARALSLPTPGGSGAVQGVDAGAGEMELARTCGSGVVCVGRERSLRGVLCVRDEDTAT